METARKSSIGTTIVTAFVGLAVTVLVGAGDYLRKGEIATKADSLIILEKGKAGAVDATEKGVLLASGPDSSLNLLFEAQSVLRLAPNTRAQLLETTAPQLEVAKGRLWINSSNAGDVFTIKAGPVSAQMRPGVVDVQVTNELIIFEAVEHPLTLSFYGQYLLVPEGMLVKMSRSKLEKNKEEIGKLYYSKLVKEFSPQLAKESDAWQKYNKPLDEKFHAQLRETYAAAVREQGPALLQKQSSSWSLINTLTFDPNRRTERAVRSALDIFHRGVYLLMTGNQNDAKVTFDEFLTRIVGEEFDAATADFLNKNLSAVAFARPDDAFFPAKSILRRVLYTEPGEKLFAAFDDVLDTARGGTDSDTKARTLASLRRFSGVTGSLIQSIPADQSRQTLFVMNLLFADFLHTHGYALREEFVGLSEVLEDRLLAIVTDKEEQVDMRHFFVTQKLDELYQLKDALEKGSVDFDQARDTTIALARRIEIMRPALANSAFVAYLDDQYKELNPFLSFIRSSAALRLHGSADFQKNFDDYTAQVHESTQVRELLNESNGGTTISPFRREQLAETLSTDLGELFEDIQVIFPESEESGQVKVVNALFEGKNLTGIYDVERKLFSEIVFDEKPVPNAIKLNNIKTFLLVSLGKLSLTGGQQLDSLVEKPDALSTLQKIAREKLLEKLTKAGVVVDPKYIGMEDYATGTIHIRLAQSGEGADTKVFAFDVEQGLTTVSQLKVQTVSGEIPVNDTFTIAELPLKVEQIYQRALFEKQQQVQDAAAEESSKEEN